MDTIDKNLVDGYALFVEGKMISVDRFFRHHD